MTTHPLWLAPGLLLLLSCRAPADAPLFSRQVTPTLYKLGCSAGTCHGAFAGKGSFRLSLFASDPRADYDAIRSEGQGRRIDRLRPEDSLLLRKPTGRVSHGGGVRLRPGSPEYDLLRSWFAGGLPYDGGKEGAVLSLRVEPAVLSLEPGGPPCWRGWTASTARRTRSSWPRGPGRHSRSSASRTGCASATGGPSAGSGCCWRGG